jgi:chemotaxis protein methyltransferase CheR
VTPGAATDLDGATIGRLADLASRWTGVRSDAVHPENLRRATRVLLAGGMSVAQLLLGAEGGEPCVVDALRAAVSIGETYFFRHPEQLRLVQQIVDRAAPRGPAIPFRAWSAGCATGEETYSVSSLLHHSPHCAGSIPQVLGTDQLAAHIETARAGRYRPWSTRPSGPLAHPLYRELDDGTALILDELRAITRFEVHNLLHPAPGSSFDLILCRNVLIYYPAETALLIVSGLMDAMAPSGLLVLGVADPVPRIPPGLQPEGAPELRVYRRRSAAVSEAPARPARIGQGKRPPTPRTVAGPTRTPSPRDPIELHLEALARIEGDERAAAAALLAEIRRASPSYLPVHLEQALLHHRCGERAAAIAAAGELLDRLGRMADDAVLPGPEPLPASYYRAAAEGLLTRLGAAGGR